MDEINLKQIITEFPDCVSNGAKLKSILLDTYPEVARGIINAILIISNSGIAKEIQNSANIDKIATDRWLKKLENDYCMSGKTIEACLNLWIEAIVCIKKSKVDTNNPKFIYHKQLGYGKILNYGKTISVKFNAYPYKVYTYHSEDLQSFLKIVSEKEYDANTKSVHQCTERKTDNELSDMPMFDPFYDLYDDNTAVFEDGYTKAGNDMKSRFAYEKAHKRDLYDSDLHGPDDEMDYGYLDDVDYNE